MLTDLFPAKKSVLGVIHVGALPGMPAAARGVAELVAQAVGEARLYRDGGMDGLIVENHVYRIGQERDRFVYYPVADTEGARPSRPSTARCTSW